MATKKKNKGPVLKKMSPEARRVRTAQARKLAKEAASSEARRIAQIRQQMEEAVNRAEQAEDVELRNRIVRGLGSVLKLVASSYPKWDNDVAFRVELAGTAISGWTDWRTVNVRFPRNRMVVGSDGSLDNPLTRSSVGEVLGIGYHEVGHILYSTKYEALVEASTDADTTPDNSETLGRSHHTAWNAVEDQRMELAVTDASPDIAGYFTAMYLRNFLDGDLSEAWWLAVGRLYLPTEVRTALQDQFVQKYGSDVEQRLRGIVRGYTTATDLVAMAGFVRAYATLWTECHPNGGDPTSPVNGGGRSNNHSNWDHSRSGSDEPNDPSESAASGDRWDDAETAADESKAPTAGNSSKDDGPKDDAVSQGSGSGGGGERSEEDGESATDRVRNALDDATSERDSDHRVDDALKTISQTEAADYLPYVKSRGRDLSNERLAEADRLTGELERALEVANAYNSPSWRRRQEQGAVDPLAYRTRRAGDPEFRRQRTGDGSKGYDVAVSLVLDTSGSMMDLTDDLSVAAIAVKQACWNLGIPCTVTTFDTDAHLVFDLNDAPEPVSLMAGGGTYPAEALATVPLQRDDRSDHLVLLLTDGECCNGLAEVRELQQSGAFVLGVGLGSDWSVQRLREDMSVDEAHFIAECSGLPVLVEDWLTRTVSVGR